MLTQKDIEWFRRYTKETHAANAVYKHLEKVEGKTYLRYFRTKNVQTWLYLRALVRAHVALGVK
jgi:hypothetical protein